MSLKDREFEAFRKNQQFKFRITPIPNRTRSLERENYIIIERMVHDAVSREYDSYKEGEYEAILNAAYMNITNRRIFKL